MWLQMNKFIVLSDYKILYRYKMVYRLDLLQIIYLNNDTRPIPQFLLKINYNLFYMVNGHVRYMPLIILFYINHNNLKIFISIYLNMLKYTPTV